MERTFNMKKQIIILTLTFCLLLTSCSDRQISSSNQQENQQSDVVEQSKAELSESDLSSLRSYAVTFAGFYDIPFSSTAEIDYEIIGRNSLFLIATGENSKNFETDSCGYPYVEKELLQEYVSEHFGIENYEYPVSDNPNILPQYDENKNAYLTGTAGDGPRSKITIQNEIVSDENITYTIKFETPNIETGEIMETRNVEYKFDIISKNDGYVLKAISAAEQAESDVSSEAFWKIANSEYLTIFGNLINCDDWNSADEIPVYMYYAWYRDHINSTITPKERLE